MGSDHQEDIARPRADGERSRGELKLVFAGPGKGFFEENLGFL